jgi:hypothetical protein
MEDPPKVLGLPDNLIGAQKLCDIFDQPKSW